MLFPVFGFGLGGCIATLTEVPGALGEVQNGSFIRNSTIVWMGRTGLGYRIIKKGELIVEGRVIRFYNSKFQYLNYYNIGFSLGYKL